MKDLYIPLGSKLNLSQWFKFGAALVIVAIGAGCGRTEDKKPASQVAAKVNGEEITVHQINDLLARQSISPEQADSAKHQILERLIDRELAKQQAVENRLDRTPRTVQAIETARNEILASAYLEQIAAAQGKPRAEDVKRYYGEHPELFMRRRLYSIEELVVGSRQIDAQSLRERVAKSKDLTEVTAWLRSQKAEVAASRGVRAAEQLPLSWLSDLHAMKDGEVRLFENGERLHVVHLIQTREASVDAATAAPRIEQFLMNRQVSEAIAKEVKQLRDKSNIEYVGEFKDAGRVANLPTPPTAPQAQSETPLPASDKFDKGIRGLR